MYCIWPGIYTLKGSSAATKSVHIATEPCASTKNVTKQQGYTAIENHVQTLRTVIG